MKISIVVPVYFNEETLQCMYDDLVSSYCTKIDYEYEIIFVNDGSKDSSGKIIDEIARRDSRVRAIHLSRNFGSHAAVLCGLENCTGDCAVVKAADMQEPISLIWDMVEEWRKGYNVVLAVREDRDEARTKILFANLYYAIVRKVALKNMPAQGFDVYLVDRKVIDVLSRFDEKNSALTCQILWSGFKTKQVMYHRLERVAGKSRWTLKKKVRLVLDTLFSFTSLPITLVLLVGFISVCGAIIWSIVVLICRLLSLISVSGWTSLFIFNLFSFGVIMMTLGILGEYLWRTFDASRKRPPYIIEEDTKCLDSKRGEK